MCYIIGKTESLLTQVNEQALKEFAYKENIEIEIISSEELEATKGAQAAEVDERVLFKIRRIKDGCG